MKEIQQSAGSAEKEMGIVQETLTYKANAFKQTWIDLLTELADRGTIGDLIDAFTKLSEVITSILSNKTALIGLLSTIVGIKATKNNVGGLKNTSPLLLCISDL